MILTVPKEDKIIVSHGEEYKSQIWAPKDAQSQDTKQQEPKIRAEEVLQKYKEKCMEAGVNM
jgi:hypothetical protein